MIIEQIRPDLTIDLRHRILWPNHPREFVLIPEDDQGYHYGAYVEGKLVSVISCFITGNSMQFRKFATETNFQGQGIGTALLRYVIDQARLQGIQHLWCNARVDKISFYQKFGLQATGEPFMKEGIAYIQLSVSGF